MAISQNKLSIRAPALERLGCKHGSRRESRLPWWMINPTDHCMTPESVAGIFATWNNFFCDRVGEKQPRNTESSQIPPYQYCGTPRTSSVFFIVQKITFLNTETKMKMQLRFSCKAKCLLNIKPSHFSEKKNLLFSKHFEKRQKGEGSYFSCF